MSSDFDVISFDSGNHTLFLPEDICCRYNFCDGVTIDELTCGLLVKPSSPQKLGWKETCVEMAAGCGEFSRWQDIDDGEFISSLTVKRLDIFQARIAPLEEGRTGAELPVIIISNDILNESLPTVMACPLTENLHPKWRCRVGVVCAGKEMEIAVDQLRVIHKSRLLYKLDVAGLQTAREIALAMSQMYSDADIGD